MSGFNPQKIKNRLSNAIPAADIVPLHETDAAEKQQKADTKIIKVRLDDLVDFQNHPFSRGSDEKMEELAESIRQNGLISPPIVRPAKEMDGKYEILAGHRRRDACETIGLEEVEVVFRDVDDDAAALIMVSSNLEQRDKIFPVEKGYAYKMMLEALKRKAGRPSENYSQVGNNLNSKTSSEELAETVGESKVQSLFLWDLGFLV